MSDEAYGATVAKRRLSRRLTQLRIERGYTANHVCDMLNWGRGKVGRFEANQWRRPEMSDIRDLLRIYEVEPAEQEELEELAMRARARPWWRDYPEVFDNEFAGFESDASSIRVFMPLVLPGLLQTPDYVDALVRTGARSPVWRRRAVESRLRRQEILNRGDDTTPKLKAVITEASLMYRWGSRAERRDQLAHLADLSIRPGIQLYLQRFADGPPQGVFSTINIFDFPGGEPSLVYTETDYMIQEVSDSEEVARYVEAFDRTVDAALEPADTTIYLKQFAERLE
ncbi:MAG TPA: helix-turn-helix transcriptional regulator [Streptosporangiaceae bacterium]|jgi:transcriptional regulator with XRE-family HTH domain